MNFDKLDKNFRAVKFNHAAYHPSLAANSSPLICKPSSFELQLCY